MKKAFMNVRIKGAQHMAFSLHATALGAVRAAEQCRKMANDGETFEAFRVRPEERPVLGEWYEVES